MSCTFLCSKINLEDGGLDGDGGLAAGQRLEEGVEGGGVAVALDDVGAGADEGHDLGAHRLALLVRQDAPHPREKVEPHVFRQPAKKWACVFGAFIFPEFCE